MLEPRLLEEALSTLGAVLEDRGLHFELVTLGGSSLMLLGLLDRPTKDLDVVALVRQGRYVPARPFPDELRRAAQDVGRALDLGEDWLNPGPTDLLTFGLPEGFEDRAHRKTYGGLVLHVADRRDQICFKVYAAADQGPRSKHLRDLELLGPTREELLRSGRWARTHDPSDGFLVELRGLFEHLGVANADL